MLPDYIIYDELKRERERREQREERPRLEIPLYMPQWPRPEQEESGSAWEKEYEGERGEAIIII